MTDEFMTDDFLSIQDKIDMMQIYGKLNFIKNYLEKTSNDIEAIVAVDGHVDKEKFIRGINDVISELDVPIHKIERIQQKLLHIRLAVESGRDIQELNKEFIKKLNERK